MVASTLVTHDEVDNFDIVLPLSMCEVRYGGLTLVTHDEAENCLCRCVKSDILICSNYLVSGLHGVNDTALSSSSFLQHEVDCRPKNARLYYAGDVVSTPERLAGWQSGVLTTDQFIQVTFPVDTTITAVTVQGRYNGFDEWVTYYYLLYSMDGVTWTTVTSPDGSPKLFNGSIDRNTPVTSLVTPNVTARHLRINPQSWEGRITLRFDVSGCQVRKLNDGRGQFARKSVILTEEMVGSHTVITAMTTVPFMKDCAITCHKHSTCMSFTYQTANGIQWCTGYNAWIVVPGQFLSDIGVFVNQDILDMYGYKEDKEANILYTIIEVRKDQAGASTTCTTQHTRLMKVDTANKLTSLQNTIAGYDVLKQDFRFYVSGIYSSPIWSYSGETEPINCALWSPGNPDPSQGHCVMLTQTGLTSVDCQQGLFAICGN